jgi:hypothetical protein
VEALPLGGKAPVAKAVYLGKFDFASIRHGR